MVEGMWDPVGMLITEARDEAAVVAIVGANPAGPPRVRGPKPGTGDVQGSGAYRAFMTIVLLAGPPHPSVPIQRTRHLVTCYGRTPEEAEQLYVACHQLWHHRGPRQTGSGHGIYVSHNDTGGSEDADPDTGQPLYRFVLESLATTQVIAPE